MTLLLYVGITLVLCAGALRAQSAVNWKPYWTLNPNEGTEFAVDTTRLAPDGVPVVYIAPDGKVLLHYGGGGSVALQLGANGATVATITASKSRPADGGVIYLPDGRMRFLSEEQTPNSMPPMQTRSRIVSAVSSDGITWTREPGIRYQPGAADDSASSVPSFIQVRDSIWRMYYVGDFNRANGTRTALSTDWGLTWKQETTKNILTFQGDVDPHIVSLSNGGYRLYFRTKFNLPDIAKAKRGIAYCDSNDGVTFDTTAIRLVVSDTVAPALNKLDPWVIKFPSGAVACYMGVFDPRPVVPQTHYLVAAWAKQTTSAHGDSALLTTAGESDVRLSVVSNPDAEGIGVRVELLRAAHTLRVVLIDAKGREIAGVVRNRVEAGRHIVTFPVRGDLLPSGIYFAHVWTERSAATAALQVVH